MIDPWLLARLACPTDGGSLRADGGGLRCAEGHVYAVEAGIPVLMVGGAVRVGAQPPIDGSPREIDPFVQRAVVATCGNLYRPLRGRLPRYPIPELRIAPRANDVLLDVGCNWGRWSVSAARRGFHVIGVDHNVEALLAARRVARESGVRAHFVAGDARALPFRSAAFDVVFSYSVLQHLPRNEARRAFREIARVMRPGGRSLVQMANAFGVRSLTHILRRGARAAVGMEVRYWRPATLVAEFSAAIGPTRLTADGFGGLGVQPADADLLPARYRALLRVSEALRAAARVAPWLHSAADSVYLESVRPRGAP
ncbi:MAG TPA: class I SAM-dependent methyltransferase [Longimicrobium sp.]|nr:class I SAM-dependent methyltransferase [Longimicrobium sp.]